ncbi:MAG: phosphocholine cytidylyltransferase family protein [Prevotella sp.]|nr:phosphocholine cytidylyltransferase family protein [Prevotella sp.]MDE6355304.1 phosphocholine cytidylyltransferase family protein [Prevotella sp.]
MIAVILAAGMASRLRPLTDDRPKCLLKVGSRTLLQRTVDALLAAGDITELVVVTGYRGDMIRSFLTENYPHLAVRFVDNADYGTTNNIYSLWLTRGHVAGRDFILLDSDILFDPQTVARVLSVAETNLALNRHELGEEEIKIITDGDGFVTEISKTCSIGQSIGESVGIEKMNAGYSKALFEELETMICDEKQTGVFYERAFERLIPRGHKFRVTDVTDLFSMELDTVEDFEQAKDRIPEELF